MAVGCAILYAFRFLSLWTTPVPLKDPWVLFLCQGCHLSPVPSSDAAWLRRFGSLGGSSTLPCNPSERSLLNITTQNLCNTLHCCCCFSGQRTRAEIHPGLSHGNDSSLGVCRSLLVLWIYRYWAAAASRSELFHWVPVSTCFYFHIPGVCVFLLAVLVRPSYHTTYSNII